MGCQLISVLVADRDDAVRAGIGAVLDRHAERFLIDEARTANELIQKLPARQYDLVILEPLFGRQNSEELIKTVREIAPHSNLLVFTVLDELTHGIHAITSGAKGFLVKTCSIDEFTTAAQRVRSGRIHISPLLAEKFALQIRSGLVASPYESLTERELEVYAMLVCGKRTSEIASHLQLSPKTVSTHKSRIFSKFGLYTLTGLVYYAISHGLMADCRSRLERLGKDKLQ